MANILKWAFPLHMLIGIIVYSSSNVFTDVANKTSFILEMIPSIKDYVNEATEYAGSVADE
jgi:hypothetical protein